MRHSHSPRAFRRITFSLAAITLAAVAALTFGILRRASGQVTLTDVNPNQSTLDPSNANGASGGRVNGLATTPGNNQILYAASEWGGLYKTTDGARNWFRLNNHRPTVTWDVEVSPSDANRVIATSFYDGRVNSLAGINLSADGGNTWTHPATATPPAGFCIDPSRRDEPSAFGISFDPSNGQNVYVGTNCGLAVSNNGGNTWTFIDPTPGDGGADDIWDVVVHHGGIIDLVGDDGHQRSTTSGASWTTATSSPLPSGAGSIAASPDESYVLFAVVGLSIFESDNGGTSWTTSFANPAAQGRIPFVATNKRTGSGFDLWFGDTQLFRAGCTTPASPMPGGAARCPASGTWTNSQTGAHWDLGDIAFDTGAASDRCPRVMSSDGGVYFNTNTATPGCHTPAWEQPDATPHGLWLFGMSGVDQAGAANEDLYFGCQDNGTFAATNAGAAPPAWNNRQCCDGFDDSADAARIVYTVCCCPTCAQQNRLFVRNPGMTGGGELNNYPAGNLPGFKYPDVVDRFDANSYVLLTTSGIFITTNIGASPVMWSPLGAATTPAGACGVEASGPAATPSFFVQTGSCDGRSSDRLWRYNGTATTGTWQQVNRPGGAGGFGVITVDPNNPNRLFASHLPNGTSVNMVFTTNGGATWATLAQLDNLMTGGGVYRAVNTRGPTDFTGFGGYPQPTFVAFDPGDGNTLMAGGADSGIFLSTNAGASWTTLTDNSGGGNPHIPRPRFAYFDREAGTANLYVGTQGRGVWRIAFQDRVADLAVTKTAAPATVTTGSNVTYTITVTNNGPDEAQSVSVTDILPPSTSYVSCNASAGGVCTGTNNNRTVTFGSLAANASATIMLVATVSCSVADGTVISNTASAGSLARDTNPANNTATATATASNPAPIITCPADINAGTDPGQCFATLNPGTATAVDNCPGVIITGTRSDGRPLNAPYPVAVTTITWKATDSGGRMSTCAQTITVKDTQPPVITCPEDVVAVTMMLGITTTTVNYPPPVVMDNCPGAVTVCTPPSGSTFTVGATTVNCKVTDISNNMASCSFKVTVYDVCLQDDRSNDYLLFNSFTGDYQFTRCQPGGITFIGIGMIDRTYCITSLGAAKVTASVDKCLIAPAFRGSARIKPNPIGGWFYIEDSDTRNNTCKCT